MSNKNAVFKAPDGSQVVVKLVDSGQSDGLGNQLYRLGVDSAVSIDPGTITIGAVTIKDQDSATNADVGVVTTIAEGSNALAVQAPILGKTTDAADQTGSTTTLNAKLRGLLQIFADIWVSASHWIKTHDPNIGDVTDTIAQGTVIGYLNAIAKPALSLGVAGAAFQSADQSGGVAAVTDAPAAGKKLVISHLIVSTDTANMIITFSEETTGTVKAVIYANANSPALSSADIDLPLTTANKKLMVRTNKAGNIAITAMYYSV